MKQTLLAILCFFLCNWGIAQRYVRQCEKLIEKDYFPQEKEYKIQIGQDEQASFHMTFYNDYQYRIAVCSNISDGNLVFTIYDPENKMLFSNKDYNFSQYWDFRFKSTIECVIKVEIQNYEYTKAMISLLVGYKGI